MHFSMKMIRLGIVLVMLLSVAWQVFQFVNFDELELKTQVSTVPPARFLQVDEGTVEELQERLEALKPLNAYLRRDVSPRNFGRERLFYPYNPSEE